jgi:hypothetical protein
MQITDFKKGDKVRIVPIFSKGNPDSKLCENGMVLSINDTTGYISVAVDKNNSVRFVSADQLVKL